MFLLQWILKFISGCSFYPLYPPALGVPVDFSLAIEALEIPRTPDVLILPSDLAPFVKVISILATSSHALDTFSLCMSSSVWYGHMLNRQRIK